MVVAIAALALIALVLAIQLIRSEWELRRIAQLLTDRKPYSNARVTISVHTRGFVRLGQAINRQLDRHQGEHVAAEDAKLNLKRGLTYLSHDIRTPLTGARGYAQLLGEERDEVLRARYLEAVDRRLGDVGSLLDQLYVYAQVQDPEYRIERDEVDANRVLANALVSLYVQFEEKGWSPAVELEDEKLVVLADADALTRIFRNLTTNALRYGCEAPRIVQRGNVITFSNRVADPGALDAERLFERFYQGDAARSGEGSGLGLAIVAHLAKALRIQIDGRLEKDVLSISLEFPPYAEAR